MLVAKIKVEEQDRSMLVYDCTGKYSPDNKGGFSGPNPTIERVKSAYLHICPPGQAEYIHKLDVSAFLPNKDGIPMEVYPSQVGQSGPSFESGKYKFKYEITVSPQSGPDQTTNAYFTSVFTSQVECCVDEQAPSIDINKMKDPRQQKIVELSNLLESTMVLIDNGDYDKADKNIKYIKSYCNCPNCP